jgi:hypothetical protein
MSETARRETEARARPPRLERKDADEAETSEGGILGLQGLIGNRAVTDLIRDGGTPLSSPLRATMESRFGRDFGDVRVHRGPAADDATRRANAAALTAGSDIVVSSATPGADTPVGQAVMGEELAHVAQGVGTAPASRFTEPGGSIETEAHEAGLLAARGESVSVGPAVGGEGAAGRFILPIIAGAAIAYGVKQLLDDDEEAKRLDTGVEDAAKKAAEAAPKGVSPEQKTHIETTLIAPMTALAGEIRSSSKTASAENFKQYHSKVTGLRPTIGAVGAATEEASTVTASAFQNASEFVDRAETALLGATLSLSEAATQGVLRIDQGVSQFGSLPVVPEAPPEPGQPEPTGITALQRKDLEATVIGPAAEAKAILASADPDFPEALARLDAAATAARTFRSAYNLPPALMSTATKGRDELIAAYILVQSSLRPEEAAEKVADKLELAAEQLKGIPVIGPGQPEEGAAAPAPAAAPAAPPPG